MLAFFLLLPLACAGVLSGLWVLCLVYVGEGLKWRFGAFLQLTVASGHEDPWGPFQHCAPVLILSSCLWAVYWVGVGGAANA